MRCNDNREIVIISAYRVCSSSLASIGDKTAAAQQYCTLLSTTTDEGRTNAPHPHRQFLLDLQAWITLLQNNGAYIIVLLDNNEDINQHFGTHVKLDHKQDSLVRSENHNAALTTLLLSCNLVDSLSVQHPAPYPATYICGKKRLDYVLISVNLIPAIQHTSILPFHQLCLGGAPPSYPRLRRKDPKIVSTYKSLLHKQLQYHKVNEKLNYLKAAAHNNSWTKASQEEYEKLDKIITEAILHAEYGAAPYKKKVSNGHLSKARLPTLLNTGTCGEKY
jgi:hypothetical protein